MPRPVDLRRELHDLIVSDLVGPAGGEREVLADPRERVSVRYLAGILAPRGTVAYNAARHDRAAVDGDDALGDQSEGDDTAAKLNRTGFLGDLISWEDGVYGTSESVFHGGARARRPDGRGASRGPRVGVGGRLYVQLEPVQWKGLAPDSLFLFDCTSGICVVAEESLLGRGRHHLVKDDAAAGEWALAWTLAHDTAEPRAVWMTASR